MRKGHGSTKVPGVKLRPAAPTKANKSGLSLKQPAWVQSSHHDDVDSIDILKSCQKPFVGIVISASGVSDKVNLFQQAVQLGAHTSSDLTDRVTHLICEGPGSAKYTYCVEHGVPIMRTSWITDAYGKWLSGEIIDVAKSIIIHRLEIFKTVRLCLTAIDDVQKRKQIRKQLEKNGGTYIDVLGKDSQLTHLLCGPDREGNADEKGLTSKMQYVEKYNRSSDAKVHLVWEDWFWDCLEFKGVLTENDYQATGPRPQRRIVREVSPLLAPIASTAEPRQHSNASFTTPTADTSLDVEEIANIKRVPEVTARLLEGMLKKRGFEVKNGNLRRSPSKARISSSAFNDSFMRSPSPTPIKRSKEAESSSSRVESSLNAAFKRTKSFAAKAAEPEATKSALQRIRSTPAATFKRTSSSSGVSSHLPSRNEDSHIPEGEKALFIGLKFRTLGEAKGPKLTEALQLRGGIVFEEPNEEVDFIIVRLAGGDTFYHDEPDEHEREKFRTECWIEQCMFEERICASSEHPAFVPLQIRTPIPGADTLAVHISGLTAAEKTPSVRLIKAIGAKVTEQLSRKNTHLICPCGSGPKFSKAKEWQIPIIGLQWLFETVKAGEIQSILDYLVTPTAVPSAKPSDGIAMADITNSEFVQGSSKGKSPSKGSDRSHSSKSSIGAAIIPQCAVAESFSDSWTASELLSDTVPDHPPTSSPTDSPRAHTTRPTTPSPRRRRTDTEIIVPDASASSILASPTKPKKSTMNLGRVPSSATPSPLKMPVNSTRSAEREGTATSASSATTLSSESASVLKDAIASLLGKRSSSDDHEADGASVGSAAQPPGPPARASKRSKPPPRTKSRQDSSSARAFSRTASIETLSRGGSGLAGLDAGYPFEFSPIGRDASNAPEAGSGVDVVGAAEESMRVTYEDPSQRAEQRRLMSLIAGDGVAEADATEAKVDEGPPILGKMVVVGESQDENKKRQPQPRRRGRNLVRRAGQN